MSLRFAASFVFALLSINGSSANAEGITDQILIKTSDRLKTTAAQGALAMQSALVARGHSSKILRQMTTGEHVLKLSGFVGLSGLKRILADIVAEHPELAYAEPDVIAIPLQNDPFLNQQWSIQNTTAGINAIGAWNYSTGTGVTIAIVDTGTTTHYDLAANLLTGYDFISSTSNSNDGNGRDSDASDPGNWRIAGQCAAPLDTAFNSNWHGTAVAGIAAAVGNNGSYITGVSYSSKILPVRVIGTCGAYASDIADGIIWASGGTVSGIPANANPAKVINVSLGSQASCPSVIQTAINSAISSGAVVVVAAGNDAVDVANETPANCNNVIAVAATNQAGGRASFSNYGSSISLSAPGDAMISIVDTGTTAPVGDGTGSVSGTSTSAPHVSGTAALMFAANPSLTVDDVKLIMKGTSSPFPNTCTGCGAGIVNAAAAVNAVKSTAAKGSFSQTYITRQGSNKSVLVLSNNGTGWLMGIRASCSQYGAQITTQPVSALAPGQSTTIMSANNPYSYTCGFVVQANNAVNSPYTNSSF